MNRPLFLSLLAGCCAGLTLSVSAATPGLHDWFVLAEQHSPTLAAAAAARSAAEARIVPAAMSANPTLLIGMENLPISGADAFDANADFMSMRRVGWTQTHTRRALRAQRQTDAEIELGLKQLAWQSERLQLHEAVQTAIINWQAAVAMDVALRARRTALDVLISQADARWQSGLGEAGALVDARAGRLDLDDRLDENMLALRGSELVLVRLLGQRGFDQLQRQPPAMPDPQNVGAADLQTLLAKLPRHREFRRFAWLDQQAELRAAMVQGEQRPQWSYELSYADRGPRFDDMVSLMLRIEWPWPKRRRHLTEAEAHARAALAEEIEAERRTLGIDLEQRWLTWRLAERRVARLMRDRLPLARDAEHLSDATYRGGESALVERLTTRLAADDLALLQIDRERELALAATALQFLFIED